MRTDKVLALITARGGSKGLPRKNVLCAGGKPLIAWTVEAALGASSVDSVVLSTDDEEITAAAIAAGCNVPFRRPAELASDTASSIDVVFHALDQLSGFDYVVLLQPTSPLRTSEDIDSAFALMVESGAPCCVSVSEAEQSPYWMYQLTHERRLKPLLQVKENVTRRQELPPAYVLNGAIYIARIDWLTKTRSFLMDETVAYHMPRERSIDIDTKDDFLAFLSKVEKQPNS